MPAPFGAPSLYTDCEYPECPRCAQYLGTDGEQQVPGRGRASPSLGAPGSIFSIAGGGALQEAPEMPGAQGL